MSEDESEIDGLHDFLSTLRDKYVFSRKESGEIVDAGARIVAEKLRENTPYDENAKMQMIYGKEYSHLRDGITYKVGQFANGSTDVGFKDDYWQIANWVDHGTYRQKGQFFMEKTFQELNDEEVFGAIADKAKQIISENHSG